MSGWVRVRTLDYSATLFFLEPKLPNLPTLDPLSLIPPNVERPLLSPRLFCLRAQELQIPAAPPPTLLTPLSTFTSKDHSTISRIHIA